jgi:heme a synthase
VPQGSSHALIEFSNRAISGIAMLAAVAAAVMAYRVAGLDRRIAHAMAFAAAGTVAQVPLGAVTVEFDLNPYLVMSHFLLAMAVVSVATWATLRALRPQAEPAAPDEPFLGLLAWAAVAVYLALIVSGAFVTAAGPHPGSTSTPIERLGNFYDAAWVHVRVATAFTVVFLGVAVWLWRRHRGTLAQRLAIAGVVLLGCQAGVGEYQYRNGLPWAVIAVHVALAATLLITVVTVAALVWERAPADPAAGRSSPG